MTINYNHTARIIPELINGNKELILNDILVSKEILRNFIEKDSYLKASDNSELTLKELSEEKYELGNLYYIEFFDNYISDQDDSRIIVIALNKGKIRYFRVDAKDYLYEINIDYLNEELLAKLDDHTKDKVIEFLKSVLLEDIIKIPVGISNRHVHLTKGDLEILFGQGFELEVDHELSQKGQFASKEKVKIKTEYGEIDNVRILGPVRDYTQIEISKTDAYKFKVNPMVRRSGEVDNTDSITVVGPKGEIQIPVIIANRHIHITSKQASELNVKDRQKVGVKILSEKPGVIVAEFKVSDEAFLELHIDTDDANAFLINQDDEVEVIL